MQDRYSRQTLFRRIGPEGQARLRQARVAIVGCGALGTHSANALVRAGVGTLHIYDRDFVEWDNLQRQILFDEADVKANLPKSIAAARKLRDINSEVVVEPHVVDVNYSNAEALLQNTDLVIDGTDNFETRFVLNDAALKGNRPFVYAGCVGSYGMVLTVRPGQTPCLRCFVDKLPEPGKTATCDTAGVIHPAVGVVSSIQVAEVLKLIVGDFDALIQGLAVTDVWANTYQVFKLDRDPHCRACTGNYEFLTASTGTLATTLCGRNAVQVSPGSPAQLDLRETAKRLSPLGQVTYNEYLLKFLLDEIELTLFQDGRAIVKGTHEPSRARTFYAKYVGT